MINFEDFMLPAWLKQALVKMGYSTPTPIQEQAIPIILEGQDLLGTAQTGTGKTGAFLIPLLAYLHNNKNQKAIILTPTRELAMQVHSVALQMMKNISFFKSALLIGGDSMPKQFSQLKHRPRLIVGTPGRINDHLQRGTLKLDDASFAVLDETDRMLDMGFGIQIDEIFSYLPQQRQVLLFSATMPKEILKLVDNYLKNPAKISVGEVNTIAKNVTQEVILSKDKYTDLLGYLEKNQGTSIIFVKTQRMTEVLCEKLEANNFRVDVLHGGLKQSKRSFITKAFRAKKFDILVATDVASRGLDIPHIENVINYDITTNPEDYVHRIGRTARAEKEGKAVTLINSSEVFEWNKIQKFIGKEDTLLPETKGSRPSNKKGGSKNSSGKKGSFFKEKRKDFFSNKENKPSWQPRVDSTSFSDSPKKPRPQSKSKNQGGLSRLSRNTQRQHKD
jgi:ATP-dependent RNA helicase DeaD